MSSTPPLMATFSPSSLATRSMPIPVSKCNASANADVNASAFAPTSGSAAYDVKGGGEYQQVMAQTGSDSKLLRESRRLAQESGKFAQLFREAQRGGPEAQYNLAEYYKSKNDHASAYVWFDCAAAQGHIKAQSQMGGYMIWYVNGAKDIPHEPDKCFGYEKLAAEQGDYWAQWQVAQAYAYGILEPFVKKDVIEGIKWYAKAAHNSTGLLSNRSGVMREIAELYQKMRRTDLNQNNAYLKEAISWYECSCRLDEANNKAMGLREEPIGDFVLEKLSKLYGEIGDKGRAAEYSRLAAESKKFFDAKYPETEQKVKLDKKIDPALAAAAPSPASLATPPALQQSPAAPSSVETVKPAMTPAFSHPKTTRS